MNIEILELKDFLNNKDVKSFVNMNMHKSQTGLGISYKLNSKNYDGFKIYATMESEEELIHFNPRLYKIYLKYKPLFATEAGKAALSIRTQVSAHGNNPIFYVYSDLKNGIELNDEPYVGSIKGISLKSTGEVCHYFRYKKETCLDSILNILCLFFKESKEYLIESILKEIDYLEYAVNVNNHKKITLSPFTGLTDHNILALEDSIKLKKNLNTDIRSCAIHMNENNRLLTMDTYYKNVLKYIKYE